jgi:hypothetical protein
MVKALVLVPVVAALMGESDKPAVSVVPVVSVVAASIATRSKWTKPKHKGVCWSRVGSKHDAKKHASKHHKHSALAQFPGAGMKPEDIEPYDRILKDGFMKVNCIKDAMFSNGDKFGPNKHEYKYGPTANVSIVHYDAHVPKEDREKMTPEVCFNFCRTVKDMLFFGIVNGRDCYCEPYFKKMASSSESCDAVCEGDTSQMCGGKSKSNVWEMHMCNDGAQTLAEATYKIKLLKNKLDELVPKAEKAAEGKQELGEKLQAAFGQAGDPEAGSLMQRAKGAAGDLQHLAADAEEDRQKLGKLIDDSNALTGFNYHDFNAGIKKDMGPLRQAITDFLNPDKVEKFLDFDTAKAGDDLLAEITEFAPKANATYEALGQLYLLSEPVVSTSLIMKYGEDSCSLDVDTGCITTHTIQTYDYYGDQIDGYQSGSACKFDIIGGEVDVEIKTMNVENGWDYVYINGQAYTGHQGEGTTVKASGSLVWNADWCCNRPGFEICAKTESKDQGDDGIQYYPLMYFVDKEFVNVPTTCNGDLIGSPIYYKNYHGCASACDADNQNCVAFAYFPTGKGKPNMCFLFSKLTSAQYYTGCDDDAVGLHQKKSKSFLQVDSNSTQPITEEPAMAVCALKLSKFVGTNLKPDPSGKNDFKLKELTKADRCYEL